MGVNNKYTAVSGEVAAAEFLRGKGYQIIETNYLTKFAEADIIAKKGNILVFVEVKARENTKFGMPIEAVTPSKANSYRRLASFYIAKKRLADMFVRFDVISILRGELQHIENAF